MNRSIMLGALCMFALRCMPCDVCGLYLGIQPHDRTNNFGLWYRMRYLQGDASSASTGLMKHGGHGATGDVTANYTEVFSVVEARGEWWLGQRFSLMAAIPLVNNYQSVDGEPTADIYAAGDPLIMGRYVAFNTRCNGDSTNLRHRLSIGLGAKAPVARHDITYEGELLDHDLQPGTGAWDGLVALEYLMRGKRWGLGASTIARVNGTAADGYAMGHGLSSTVEAFRTWDLGRIMFMPSLGAYHELTLQDQQDDSPMEGTGTSVLFSHLSTRLWWHSFGFTLTWQHAVAQDNGAMMVPNRERVIAGIDANLINRTN